MSLPRRATATLGDRDFVDWLTKTSFLEATVHDRPSPLARLGANVQATGRGGGHDLHRGTLHARGVTLLGRLAGYEDGVAHFADDLAASVAFGDAKYTDLCGLIRKARIEKQVDVPEMPPPPPFTYRAPTSLDMRGFGASLPSAFAPTAVTPVIDRKRAFGSARERAGKIRGPTCDVRRRPSLYETYV
jgi:putative flavoprotein involved in K+ transport